MYISPSLLLLMLVIFVFAPSIQEWMTQGGTAWYRPYILWLATIVFVGWGIRRYQRTTDTKHSEEQHSNEL